MQKIKVERVAVRVSAARLATLATEPLALGGYQLVSGGFVQVYSAVVGYVPGGAPYVPAAGSRLVLRYEGPSGPACVDPLPLVGLVDQTAVAAGIMQPISCIVKSAPLFLCWEGGAPTTVGDGRIDIMLTCHDPAMRVVEDEF